MVAAVAATVSSFLREIESRQERERERDGGRGRERVGPCGEGD